MEMFTCTYSYSFSEAHWFIFLSGNQAPSPALSHTPWRPDRHGDMFLKNKCPGLVCRISFEEESFEMSTRGKKREREREKATALEFSDASPIQ